MPWYAHLFNGESIAGSVLILALVSAAGLILGNIRVFGIGLGIAGVLFSGLLFAHFKLTINHSVLEFARDFGLILFVYSIGMQVGPGFIASLRKEGLRLNLLAAGVVLTGAVLAVVIARLAGLTIPVAAGLYAGAVTNTPALASAQQALIDAPGYTEDLGRLVGLGMAIAYPFGVIGLNLTIVALRGLFHVNLPVERHAAEETRHHRGPQVVRVNVQITNSNLEAMPLREIPLLADEAVVVSRLRTHDQIITPQPEDHLHVGDVVLVVGPPEKVEQFRLACGKPTEVDLTTMPSEITSRRLIVTRKRVLGQTTEELDIIGQYGVRLTRIYRAETELPAAGNVKLQYGDSVMAVGEPAALDQVAALVGNSEKQLRHAEMIPVFIGLVLGVLVGTLPMAVPGLPAPVKLGLAGGPMLVAIILSRIGRIGPLVWYMPISANFMIRELGIILFLACVGLNSGDRFVETIVHGPGLYWMALAAIITVLPVLVVALVARLAWKINFLTLCGTLAGSMTAPPTLAFSTHLTGSDSPSIAFATVYPLTMTLRILTAQLIVLLFMG